MSSASDRTGFVAALGELHRALTPRRRRHLQLVVALMLLGGLAEMLTIGAVVPFLALLANGSAADLPVVGQLFGEGQLAAATLLFIGMILLAATVRLALAWSVQSFVLKLGHELSVEIQRRVLLQPYSYHLEHHSSEVIASLEKVQLLVGGVILHLVQAVAATIIAAFIAIALVAVDPLVAAIAALSLGAFYACVSLITRGRLARNSTVVGASYRQRVQLIQESLGGIRDVIIDQAQEAHLASFRTIDERFTRARLASSFIALAPRFLVEAAGMVLLAGLALMLAGRPGGLAAALPLLGALALGAQRMLPLLQQLYTGWTMFAGNRSVVEQVLGLLRLPLPDVAQDTSAAAVPLERSIAFEKVSFAYPGRAKPAVDAVSLVIPRGARVALTGRTGSGKSTLADLAMGLIAPSSGAILVDGVAIDESNRRGWQRGIAHVSQSIFLADASIAGNIALASPDQPIDLERVRDAARDAQLDEFVATLPDGYDTPVGERGVRLSGGQRQRLGIARALYRDAQLLVLDEATSALDEQTEAAVLAGLERLRSSGVTTLLIAHRRSTLAGCDLVVQMDNGRVAAAGAYDSLFAGKKRRA